MRPEPVPDEVSAPFWARVRAGVFAVQRCDACGTYAHPPVAVCGTCASAHLSFVPVSGRGRLLSWTIVRRALVEGFEDRVPFVYALVELDEGVRIAAELRGPVDGQRRIGDRVEVVIVENLPMFQS